MKTATLGLRCSPRGAVAVGVLVDRNGPRVVVSAFVPVAAGGDRLAAEPYHVAAELARRANAETLAEAAAAVREGRKRQDETAVAAIRDVIDRLRADEFALGGAALLVNRAGWVTDLLRYSLATPEHPAVAEGLAVRDAFRHGLRENGIQFVEVDEKTLLADSVPTLRMTSAEIEARLKELGTAVGRPWRKEQKLACLAAWTVHQS